MTVPEDIINMVLHGTKIIREEMVLLMRNDERDKIQKWQELN